MSKRKIEIRHNKEYGRYELWEIIYDPKEKLYPVSWTFFHNFSTCRKTVEYMAKKQFPHLDHTFL